MLTPKEFLATIKNIPFANSLTILILLSYPALLLTVRSSMGVLFAVLLIVSLISLIQQRNSNSPPHWDKYSITFSLAMASPVIAIFLSEAYHGSFNAPNYDWASRFLLAIPIYLALRRSDIRAITFLQYGIPLGALIGLIALKLHPFDWGGRYTTSSFFNLIHFSDTTLMLGFLSLFSINWTRKDHPLILLFKLSGFAAGVYMSVQSGERGGWLAMPILLMLWVAAHSKEKFWLKFSLAIIIVGVAAWLGYTKVDVVHSRIDLIFSDLTAYANGNNDTSIGLRLQLYSAATHLFTAHPIFGIGPGIFPQIMPSLAASGLLTPLGAAAGTSEVHNEILHKCAETGIFGLISILAVYFVPISIFWRMGKSTDSTIRIASFMGLCLMIGFFIFGLTVEIFDLKMTATFFSITLAILMAVSTTKLASPRHISKKQTP